MGDDKANNQLMLSGPGGSNDNVKPPSQQFNGQNFNAWKQVVTSYLKYREVWDVVKTELLTTDEQKRKDREALYILKSSIDSAELDKTGVCKTAHQLWKCVQENYEGSKSTLAGTVSAAWAVFCGQSGEDLITYCGRFEQLLAKLKAVSYTVPEDQKFHFFVRSLPKERREFCHTWKMVNPFGTIHDLVSAVKARYHTDIMLDGPSTERDSVALFSGPLSAVVGKKKEFKKKKFEKKSEAYSKPDFKKKPTADLKNVICNHCGKNGHKWKDCYKLRDEMKSKKTEGSTNTSEDAAIFMAIESSNIEELAKIDVWVADTGATSHVTPHRDILKNYVQFDEPRSILTGGESRRTLGYGEVHYTNSGVRGILKDVLYSPGFPTNIFSLDKAIVKGYDIFVSGVNKTVEIIEHNSRRVKLRGNKIGKSLLLFQLTPDRGHAVNRCYFGAPIGVWHMRMAHLPIKTVKHMLENNMVQKLGISPETTLPCVACLMGKQCKTSHPAVGKVRSNNVATVLHFDTSGPMDTKSLGGSRYLIVGVDEYSNYRFVSTTSTKDQVKDFVKITVNMVLLNTGKQVAEIHTDNGTEYVNSDLRGWLADKGIGHSVSAPYTPQQNGVAERAIKAIVEAARTQLIRSNLPKSLWAEACATTAYALNRAPSPRNNKKTRYELYHGHQPDVGNLRVFGQYAMVKLDENSSKWQERSKLASFVGYTERYNTYKFYTPESKKIFVSSNARFMPVSYEPQAIVYDKKALTTPFVLPEINLPQLTHTNVYDHSEISKSDESGGLFDPQVLSNTPDHGSTDAQTTSTSGTYNKSNYKTSSTRWLKAIANGRRMTDTDHTASMQEVENVNDAIHREIVSKTNIEDAPSISGPITRSRAAGAKPLYQLTGNYRNTEMEQVNLTYFTCEDEPTSIAEALAGDDRAHWENAIRDEISALDNNKTWSVVEKPLGCKPIKSRWIFKIKRHPDNTIDKYKARLVAKGFSQIPGVDYGETFAPVASMTTVRLIIAMACHLSMGLYTCDVKTAFLHGDLDEEIYLDCPEVTGDSTGGTVCKLRKSLYGLKQAPRMWNRKFDELLRSFELNQSVHDDCLYYTDDLSLVLAIYVDDCIIAYKSEPTLKKLLLSLNGKVEITSKPCEAFLGLQIETSKKQIKVHQEGYIERMLERFGMQECNPIPTPEESGDVDYDAYPPLAEDFPYKQMVGALLYLATCTRPDISHAVSVASRSGTPTEAHGLLLKRILRYLKGTKDEGILFRWEESPNLIAYSDADYASDKATRRSTSGFCAMYGGPLMWKSVLQKSVTLSSTESEYMAGCELVKNLIPLRALMIEIGVITQRPTEVKIDNISAIRIANNLRSRQRTKHIDVRERWLSEKVDEKEIAVVHVPGEKQVADILTKGLPKERFITLKRMIMNFLLILMLCVITPASAFHFNKANPVYYKPTDLRYLSSQTNYDLTVDVVNPCNTYFSGLLENKNIETKLITDCNVWFHEHTTKSMNSCTPLQPTQKLETATNEIKIREKRIAPAIVWIGYVVVSSAVTYSVVRSEQNAQNVKTLEQAINDERVSLQKAIIALNHTRNSIHDLNEHQIELEKKVAYLNQTVVAYPKVMALLVETFAYFKDLKDGLKDIDANNNLGKVSPKLLTLTKQNLWEDLAHQWSELSTCRYEWTDKVFRLKLKFSVPFIDLRAEILEVTSFKFWNQTKINQSCRLKYAGPRYILANTTNQCYMDVDTDWVNDNALEGHPCLEGSSEEKGVRISVISQLQPTFHKEICLSNFTASTSDIQIKRINGFRHIYCYGHQIYLAKEHRYCPPYVFEIPQSEEFELNGHVNTVVSKSQVLVDPHVLMINRDISKHLKLGSIKINGVNLTTLDSKVGEMVDQVLLALGQNITISNMQLPTMLTQPFEFIGSLFGSLWTYIQRFAVIIGGVIALTVLVLISPLVQLVFLVSKSMWCGARRITRIQSNSNKRHHKRVDSDDEDYYV